MTGAVLAMIASNISRGEGIMHQEEKKLEENSNYDLIQLDIMLYEIGECILMC